MPFRSIANINNLISTDEAQTSLTMDPRVIAVGFVNDGQDVPTAGQGASLTSINNFINFCLITNVPLTNGQQITTGSCNPAPIGTIPSVDNMPSAKFAFPKNFDTIKGNSPFTIEMNIRDMATGNLVNVNENYIAAPQQLDDQGHIIGHSHVIIESLTSLDQTTPTDPLKFAFSKELKEVDVSGRLTADVISGLPVGNYRLASINTNANQIMYRFMTGYFVSRKKNSTFMSTPDLRNPEESAHLQVQLQEPLCGLTFKSISCCMTDSLEEGWSVDRFWPPLTLSKRGLFAEGRSILIISK